MKYFVRFLNLAFYMLLVLVIIGLGALHGMALWLGSDSGSVWVKTRIVESFADTGYKADIGDIGLSYMGLSVSSIAIAGDNGFMMKAENASLHFNPFPLTFKILNITLNAESLDFQQWGEGGDDETQEAQSDPFIVPDIFFNKINIAADIEKITLPDNDTPMAVNLQQSLYNTDDRKLALEGDFAVKMAGQELLPERVENLIIMDESAVNIDVLNITHPKYALEGRGRYDLNSSVADLSVKGDTTLLKDYVIGFGQTDFAAHVNGEISSLNGTIEMNSSFQESPVRITGNVEITDMALSLTGIEGTANALSLSGNLTMPFDTALIEGTLIMQSAAPSELFAMAGVEQDMNADITAEGRFYAKDGLQALSANLGLKSLDWQGMAIDTANIEADIADLYSAAIPALDIDISNLRYETTQIDKVSGRIETDENQHYLVSLSASGRNNTPFTLNANAMIAGLSPLSVKIEQAELLMDQGRLTLSGDMNADGLQAVLKGQNIAFDTVPFVSLPAMPLRLAEMELTAGNTPERPVLNGTFRMVTTVETTPSITLKGTVGYSAGQAKVNARADGQGIERLDASVAIPLQLSLYPYNPDMADNAALSGKMAALFDAEALKSFLPDNGYNIAGRINADATLSGALNDIRVNGDAALQNGRFYDPVSNISLKDVQADIGFNRENIVIKKMTASGEDDRGTLVVEGSIGLKDLTAPDIDIKADAREIHILSGPPYDVWLNADIDFTTEGSGYLLAGDLSLGEVIVQLPENRPQSIPVLNIIEAENERTVPFLERVKLDLYFEADNKIFIRGYGVDTEMAGSLEVTGQANDPQVNGELSSIRGRYEDFGRQFALERAVLRFQGSVPPSPYLDIVAAARIDEVVAKVNLGGTPVKPAITFSSEPAMPEDEVLSHILFGEDIRTISPFQAIQLANTLRRLSGRGSVGPDLNILGSIRDATGLDDIRIEGSGKDARVGAGKYISDKVYLDVSKGAGEESGSARIEIELTPSVSAESKVGQTGESDSNVFWRWDY